MKRYITLLYILIAYSCSSTQTDFTGQWSRNVEEPEMHLNGAEEIDIRTDSVITITNRMHFSHSDTTLNCELDITINVEGRWDYTENRYFHILYNPESVKVNADSATFQLVLNTANTEIPEHVFAATYKELIDGITDYYKQSYASINAVGGMTLTNPQIIDSRLFALIGDETVSWIEKQ